MYSQTFKILVFVAIAFGILHLSNNVQAKTISGYNELMPVVAKEISRESQDQMQKDIEVAESDVRSEISEGRIRRVKSGNPTKVFMFDNEYVAIGFETNIYVKTHMEKVAYVLLFKINTPDKIHYIEKYNSWKGKAISQYQSVNKKQLCNIFSSLTGIDACKKTVTVAQKTTLFDMEAALAKKADKKHKHTISDITSGRIKAKHIDSAITRDAELNAAIKTAMKKQSHALAIALKKPKITAKGPDPAYVKKLEKRIAQMEKTINRLSNLLQGVSRQKNELTFSGINLHIVNGTGNTEGQVNGLGNLIVGYNEPRTGGHVAKHTGSHNVIIGSMHSYSSYGGLVAGSTNTITGKYSSVSGGQWNTASGDYSSVSGGHLSSAKGKYSTVNGGLSSSATDENGCAGCN